jgi:acyl carrier protein
MQESASGRFDGVDSLVIDAYVQLTGTDRDVVEVNYERSGPDFTFDSVIGVEVAGIIEARTGVEIPDVELDRRRAVYRSLASFAGLVRTQLLLAHVITARQPET